MVYGGGTDYATCERGPIKYWYSVKLEKGGIWENIKYDFMNLKGT